MPKRILVIQGHPDPSEKHLGHGLAAAYMRGARKAGHSLDLLKVADLQFSLLRQEADFNEGTPVAQIQEAQSKIIQAEHLVIFYPLWLGSVPALLQGFFEQVFRPNFAFSYRSGKTPEKKLRGKSAHLVVTMGMPAPVYRWYFGAHSVKALERHILRFCGIKPVRKTLLGGAKTASSAKREQWLAAMEAAGRTGG
jgi:putative NADPH-quinone reductase